MSKHQARVRLTVESLEARLTPTVWGNPWPDAEHLTLSFAPDGTSVGPQQSNLSALLSQQSAWQDEALRAWQTWTVQANLNIGIVPDQGQPFGAVGLPQGDARFGDIRLSAVNMSREVGAISSPFEAAIGTWAGDVRLNNSYTFGSNGEGDFDLFTAFLHEAGHTLGLGPSSDTASVRYEDYQGPVTGLGAVDIAELRSLYGARTADAYEGSEGNSTFGSATRLSLLKLDGGITATRLEADITKTSDVDFYSFRNLLSLNGLTVRVQTQGQSLLAPRVSVYNSSKRLIASITSPGPNAGNLEVRINGLSLFSTYYVKVEGARGDVFGIGSYSLAVDSLPGVTGLVNTTGGIVEDGLGLLNNDLHTDDTFLTASLVPALFTTTNSRFDFAYKASISDFLDVDIYKVKAPTPPAGSANVLTVMAWGLSDQRLDPQVTICNSAKQVVAAEVLVDEAGKVTVQVENADAGATYFVKVAAAEPRGLLNFGNYFVGVDFGSKAVQMQTLGRGTLTQDLPQAYYGLTTTETQLHHFVLSTRTSQASVESALRMTVYGADGEVLFTRVVKAGQTTSFDLLLQPGTYTVRLSAGTKDKSASLPDLEYALCGFVGTDPVGPRPSDQTSAPAGDGGGSTGSTPVWTGETKKQTASDPYGDPYSPA